jgi:KaiC/GvpD/RAD55 family RecA-like ATPase
MQSNFFSRLDHVVEQYADLPETQMLFWGIPHIPSLSLITGKAKSGKTIFMENLIYALVNPHQNEFMGMDIPTLEKVVIVSLEEMITNRTARQMKQLEGMDHDEASEIAKKIFVLTDSTFHYMETPEHHEKLISELKEIKPDAVFIDSLGRTGTGKIESSDDAKKMMIAMQNIYRALNCPVIIIHHNVKGKVVERKHLMDTIAGSRYVVQEIDAAITIDDVLSNGERTITTSACRYYGKTDESITFKITEDCLTEFISFQGETKKTEKLQEIRLEKLVEFVCDSGYKSIKEIQKFMLENYGVKRSTTFSYLKNANLDKNKKGIYLCPDSPFSKNGPGEFSEEE